MVQARPPYPVLHAWTHPPGIPALTQSLPDLPREARSTNCTFWRWLSLLCPPPPSPWRRDPDVGSVQPGEAALWLVRQLAGGHEGLPGPPALPAPAGVGHSLPGHAQLLARGEWSTGGSGHAPGASGPVAASPPEEAFLRRGRGWGRGHLLQSRWKWPWAPAFRCLWSETSTVGANNLTNNLYQQCSKDFTNINSFIQQETHYE